MPFDDVVKVLLWSYAANPIHTILYLVNLFLSLIVARKLIIYASKMKGRTMYFALKYFSYAFLILALVSVAKLLSAMPWFDWALVEEAGFTLFLLIVSYAITHIAHTVEAYSQLRRR